MRRLNHCLNVDGFKLRFPNVPHVGSVLTGFERGMATIWLGNGQVSFARGHIGIGTWFCSCDHASCQHLGLFRLSLLWGGKEGRRMGRKEKDDI